MKQQAEQEGSFAAVKAPEKILGAEIVSDDDAKAMCKNVLFVSGRRALSVPCCFPTPVARISHSPASARSQVLRTLMEKRDMTVNEVKLIIQIEDPRQKERRQMGIEDSSGISRDELAFAFEVRLSTPVFHPTRYLSMALVPVPSARESARFRPDPRSCHRPI